MSLKNEISVKIIKEIDRLSKYTKEMDELLLQWKTNMDGVIELVDTDETDISQLLSLLQFTDDTRSSFHKIQSQLYFVFTTELIKRSQKQQKKLKVPKLVELVSKE